MTNTNDRAFPLNGVIGVVAQGVHEIDMAIDSGVTCVELRADLLLKNGMSESELLSLVRIVKEKALGCLYTLRHPSHGGAFTGTEAERTNLCLQAIEAGADVVDLEREMASAATLLEQGAPLILSHHDFQRMPDDDELASLTSDMLASGAWAIKVVPTAASLADAVRMLAWVHDGEQSDDHANVRRIGFAMGKLGAVSRILTLSRGAPVTYASFGDAVAPGQVALGDLLNIFRVGELTLATELVVVSGDHDSAFARARTMNQSYLKDKVNRVAIAVADMDEQQIRSNMGTLVLHDVVVA